MGRTTSEPRIRNQSGHPRRDPPHRHRGALGLQPGNLPPEVRDSRLAWELKADIRAPDGLDQLHEHRYACQPEPHRDIPRLSHLRGLQGRVRRDASRKLWTPTARHHPEDLQPRGRPCEGAVCARSRAWGNLQSANHLFECLIHCGAHSRRSSVSRQATAWLPPSTVPPAHSMCTCAAAGSRRPRCWSARRRPHGRGRDDRPEGRRPRDDHRRENRSAGRLIGDPRQLDREGSEPPDPDCRTRAPASTS